MSSPTQNNQPLRPVPLASSSSQLPIDEGRALSQLEYTATLGRSSSENRTIPPITQGLAAVQLGPANLLNPLGHHVIGYTASETDAMSVSSKKSSRFGFRKRLSTLFKGHRKDKDTATVIPATAAPARSGHCIYSNDLDVEALAVALGPITPTRIVNIVPTVQVQASPMTPALLQEIFPMNVDPAALSTSLPKPHARIEETIQFVYDCQLLSMGQPYSLASDADEVQVIPLDEIQLAWVQLIDLIEQDRLHWIVEKLVRAFVEDDLKGPAAIAEIVLLGPSLDQEMYRTLLNCFIGQFEQDKLLDDTLLQGLVQLVECASDGYLVDDELARIAAVLFKELSITHNGTSDHGSDNAYVEYQAAYAYQALQYVPDDETPLQVVWRYSKMAAAGVSAVSSIFKLDPAGLLKGLENLQKIGASVIDVVKAGINAYHPLREGAGTAVRAAEDKFDYMKRRSWYLAFQGTALFINQGRLSDFKQVVIQAPCRHDVNFQWRVCRQLGEIAVYPLWDDQVREQAIDFLGELYKSNTYWKQYEDIKRWILTIVRQISSQLAPSSKDYVAALLGELKVDGTTEFPGIFPLSARLSLSSSFPLLTRVQEIPKVEYELRRLRMQRINEYKQAVYIAPMAKPRLQASDDSLFPLIDKVEEFLAGDGQVMLILGDSGAGKSTFNRYLEYLLWQRYMSGRRIPLFINLPAINQPDQELVAEHLKRSNFSKDQIRELKHHRQLLLICDGYDE
ncbi:hypothetical protein BGW39_010298, partial [Mortierella sp. 14UC]